MESGADRSVSSTFYFLEIGVGLTAFGLFFMLMGVMMFFDGGLLAIGNVRTFRFQYTMNGARIGLAAS